MAKKNFIKERFSVKIYFTPQNIIAIAATCRIIVNENHNPTKPIVPNVKIPNDKEIWR